MSGDPVLCSQWPQAPGWGIEDARCQPQVTRPSVQLLESPPSALACWTQALPQPSPQLSRQGLKQCGQASCILQRRSTPQKHGPSELPAAMCLLWASVSQNAEENATESASLFSWGAGRIDQGTTMKWKAKKGNIGNIFPPGTSSISTFSPKAWSRVLHIQRALE